MDNKREAKLKLSRLAPKEITIDAVIKDLINLFEYLGIDSSRLADRVKDFDAQFAANQKTYTHAPAIGELLSWWHQDSHYLDKDGNPIPLRMNGKRRSFRQLASKAVPNIDVKQLLYELENIGAVSVDTRGYIRANLRSLPVYEDKRLAIQHTLASLTGFIRTLRHNLGSDPSNSEQLFHRIAWNREFDPSEIPRLKIWIRKQGQTFLESSDNWMMRRVKRTGRSSVTVRCRNSVQVSVGVYLAVDS